MLPVSLDCRFSLTFIQRGCQDTLCRSLIRQRAENSLMLFDWSIGKDVVVSLDSHK